MKVTRLVGLCALALAILALTGCDSGPNYVPVSGVVTLDGKPYPDAVVLFMPRAPEPGEDPGRGSSSYTDANGRFQLKTMDGDEGAVVGKHTVQITSKGTVMEIDPEVGSPDDFARGTQFKVDPIPREWANPGKDFEVPSGGTDQANFDIVSKKW
ncbi:MAG: hypothetical protein HY000_04130 [Planctomycetes bacterium]|nr:hypothetical protein [Planctomycetota bacterium]